MPKVMAMQCPHCEGKTKIRTSRKVTKTCREYYLQCQNINCNHNFVCMMESVRTIVPSLIPDPHVHLPHTKSN